MLRVRTFFLGAGDSLLPVSLKRMALFFFPVVDEDGTSSWGVGGGGGFFWGGVFFWGGEGFGFLLFLGGGGGVLWSCDSLPPTSSLLWNSSQGVLCHNSFEVGPRS